MEEEYDFSKAVRGPIDDPLTMLKLMLSVKYMDPRDRNTLEQIVKEVEHLRKELDYALMGAAAEGKDRDRADQRAADLENALEDCMSYVDVDNLTMQTKYRKWQQCLKGGSWEPQNVEVE